MKANDKKLSIGIMNFKILSDWSGVERVASDIAFAMDKRGHKLTVIVPKNETKAGKLVPVMPLPKGYKVIELPLHESFSLEKAKEILKKSDLDVVIAMFGGRNLLWAPWLLAGSQIPLIVAETITPKILTYERWNPYEHYSVLMAADYIQVLLPSYKKQYPPSLHNRISVIGNPSPPPAEVDFSARINKKERVLLSVGRLEERQKQYTLLLRAWNLLYPKFPDWSLKIVGDGPQNDLYRAMAKAMGKDAHIHFTGSVEDVGKYYSDSDILCLPSSDEGFGLVLVEAAAYGLPLVGLESCEASKELITPDVGLLSKANSNGENTPKALADTLAKLMSTPPEKRVAMGENAQKKLGERFSADLIFDQWEELIYKAASKKGNTRLSRRMERRWNAPLLAESVTELISRDHPLDIPEDDDGTEASIIARLQSERDLLKKDNEKLKEKYASLLNQLKRGSGKRR